MRDAKGYCWRGIAITTSRSRTCPARWRCGRWIPLEVRLSGSVIEILVDGKSLLRHDDDKEALPAGTVGLRAWQRKASYRNLWVKTGKETESFAFKQAEVPTEVSGMWRPLRRGSAKGRFALTSERPFAGAHSQHLAFTSGEGEWGVENQGLNRWGMNFVKGRPYEGYVWVRAEKPVSVGGGAGEPRRYA